MMLPILLYHSVSDEAAPRFRHWAISPAGFEAHLAFLQDRGFTPLTVTELARAVRDPSAPLPERPVAITFDDGFEDFYRYALPLLDRFRFASTLYVTAGMVGQTSRWLEDEGEGERPMMTWEQARESAQHGVEIGAHSLNHYQLDTLSREDAEHEIAGSRRRLEQHLGFPVWSFAYPHGYHSGSVRALVQQAGFTSACAVKNGMSSRDDDPFALARIIVPGAAGPEALAALLEGRGLAPVHARERPATKLWRVARRVMTRVRGRRPPFHVEGGEASYGRQMDGD